MSPSIRRSKDVISVLVITRDEITSELWKNTFARPRTHFEVKTMAGSSEKILRGLAGCDADVVLISEELQDGPRAGLKILRQLQQSQDTRAVMLLGNSEPEGVVNAFRYGARGVVYRTHSLKALAKCIRVVHQGQVWANSEDLGHLIHALNQTKEIDRTDTETLLRLTPRETEVVHLVANGLKNREIAQRLGLTEHSVKNYIYRIFEKLGVSSRWELTLYAFPQAKQAHLGNRAQLS